MQKSKFLILCWIGYGSHRLPGLSKVCYNVQRKAEISFQNTVRGVMLVEQRCHMMLDLMKQSGTGSVQVSE